MQKHYEIIFPVNEIGANIKRLRIENGISQDQLAQDLGVAKSTLWAIETGIAKARMSMIRKIAVELRIDIRQILMPENESIAKSAELKKFKEDISIMEKKIAALTVLVGYLSLKKLI